MTGFKDLSKKEAMAINGGYSYQPYNTYLSQIIDDSVMMLTFAGSITAPKTTNITKSANSTLDFMGVDFSRILNQTMLLYVNSTVLP